jgi:hypothetical protein
MIPLFAVYFYLFQRTIQLLPPGEQKRFASDAALPVWRRVAGLAPIPLLLLASATPVRGLLVAWLLVQLLADTRAHHRKLEALGFDPVFRGRLRRVSLLAGVGILMFVVGVVLRGAV